MTPSEGWSRRAFLGGLALAGTAGLLAIPSPEASAEPPPETTSLRLAWTGSTCQAPQYVGEVLLRGEGFTDVQYVDLAEAGGLPYGKWRVYDPEDTVRFYGLRLHEIGMIRSHPKKLIAQGTDWRFVNQLKKELKG